MNFYESSKVVHFKRWHPDNDYYGLSALEAGRITIASDKAMSEWNRNTFGKDNGVPAGIVNVKDFVSDADFERIKREWRQSYGGPQRRTAFLRGGGIEWQNIGLSRGVPRPRVMRLPPSLPSPIQTMPCGFPLTSSARSSHRRVPSPPHLRPPPQRGL